MTCWHCLFSSLVECHPFKKREVSLFSSFLILSQQLPKSDLEIFLVLLKSEVFWCDLLYLANCAYGCSILVQSYSSLCLVLYAFICNINETYFAFHLKATVSVERDGNEWFDEIDIEAMNITSDYSFKLSRPSTPPVVYRLPFEQSWT